MNLWLYIFGISNLTFVLLAGCRIGSSQNRNLTILWFFFCCYQFWNCQFHISVVCVVVLHMSVCMYMLLHIYCKRDNLIEFQFYHNSVWYVEPFKADVKDKINCSGKLLISRLIVVSREARKKQHVCIPSSLHGHHSK